MKYDSTLPSATGPSLPSVQRNLIGRHLIRLSLAAFAIGGICQGTLNATVHNFGVYVGSGVNNAGINAHNNFDTWLGQEAPRCMDFYPGDSWTAMKATWMITPWENAGYTGSNSTFAIPMIPNDGVSNIVDGASTDPTRNYDAHWKTIAQNLVNHGFGTAVLRIGWEFNGSWYIWRAAQNPTAWKAYWIRIVNAMRSVSGAGQLRFDWNVANGLAEMDATTVYPGNSYVNMIGVDIYNAYWQDTDPYTRWDKIYNSTNCLGFWIDFAKTNGKQLALPEWATGDRPDGKEVGGGDDPYYIEKIYMAMADTGSDIAYHNYWDYNVPSYDGRISTNLRPKAGAMFKRLFKTAGRVWIYEAEDFSNVTAPLTRVTDTANPPTATREMYIKTAPVGTNNYSQPLAGSGRQMQHNTNASGTVNIWMRVIAADVTQDSVWMEIDGNAWENVTLTVGSSWHWVRVKQTTLTSGGHTIYFANREGGLLFDSILVTDDLNLTP